MDDDLVLISLRRPTSDKSWGFALQGGRDTGNPVFVQKVTRNGLAHKSGLEPGDVVAKIGETFVGGFSHAQVKAEMLRQGSEMDFHVKKHAFNIAQYNAQVGAKASASGNASGDQRSQIVEEHVWKHGGPTFKPVQTKSYKILEEQLPQSEAGGGAPSSVFDRDSDDRSAYLKTQDKSYQKTYGES